MAEYDENQREYRFKVLTETKLLEQYGDLEDSIGKFDIIKKKQLLLRSPNNLRKNVKFRQELDRNRKLRLQHQHDR